MTLDFIEGLVRLVEASQLTELEYSENGARIRIRKRDDGTGAVSVEHLSAAASADRSDSDPPPAGSPALGHRIVAGLSGTIYRSPSPGAPPFVEVGDIVEEGQTLGIIEAMKMLSPIEADRGGRIVEICVADATPVDAGTPLFVIEAA